MTPGECELLAFMDDACQCGREHCRVYMPAPMYTPQAWDDEDEWLADYEAAGLLD